MPIFVANFRTMKKTVFATLTLLLLASAATAQVKMLKPYLSTTMYNAPGVSPYVENAIAFECRSAAYKEFEPGKFKATVEITTIFKQGDKVCNYSKVALDSPVVTDTLSIDGAFIDQQRFMLPNGEYKMEITAMDLNAKRGVPSHDEMTVNVNFPDNVPTLSDILLIDGYEKAETPSACTKSGYDFLPRVYPYYGPSDDKLSFYAELYNSDLIYDEGKFLVNYFIETAESSTQMHDFFVSKRLDVGKVNILLNTMDISNLPTGNYYLVVEMRDRSNTMLSSNSCFFQRSNPGVTYNVGDLAGLNVANTFVSQIDNIDSLRLYIRYLDPICTDFERQYGMSLIQTDDITTMQQFLLNFWTSRSPVAPKQAFDDYLAAVHRVNMSFKTTSYPGYRSDRGYVFLRYGQPDKIDEVPNEPGAYPYSIWHYYMVGNQRNKRFVFMSMDESTNDYQLIHSDMVGEVNNPRWQMQIYSRIYGQGYDQGVDQTEYERGWGSHAGDLYNTP